MKTLDNILDNREFSTSTEVCPGCENRCNIKRFVFGNGKKYYSGNQCERIYTNTQELKESGFNMFAWKNLLLWKQEKARKGSAKLRIGIPRALGIYEDYPFWHTLLTECGIEPVLSKSSTNSLYEKGLRSIMADNICFPAKLMHGHIMNLIEKKVDRIMYPWVVFEQQEDTGSRNSFNCPVVSGYSDVIRASIQPEKKYGIPMDSPVINFRDNNLLMQSCKDWLMRLGIPANVIEPAVIKAISIQRRYLDSLEEKAREVLSEAEKAGRMVILLAARPYHIDPLTEHRISQKIADMGIDVITENVAAHAGEGVYKELNALSQWAYPNRIFKAAYFVGKHTYSRLQMVELTSFGCGPDAFILDEVRSILNRYGKNLTVLKIDDVNNTGSLQLRVRSLVESTEAGEKAQDSNKKNTRNTKETRISTRPFVDEDKRRTILIPYFADGYTEYLQSIFHMAGYRVECLPRGSKEDAEEGLQDVNNEVCYPATIVLGSLVRALKSGRYDLNNTAVAITQTGGQCRASNYYSLIKNAMVKAGFADIPLVSVALGQGISNNQPGFNVQWKKIGNTMLYTVLYADAMQKMVHSAVVREKEKGAAQKVYDRYTADVQEYIRRQDNKSILRLIGKAAEAFAEVCDMEKEVKQVGLVGEIYVKYNSFSNLNVIGWFEERGIEVIPPSLSGFFLTKLPNAEINKDLHIKEDSMPGWMARLLNKYVMYVCRRFDKACKVFKPYRPFTDIYEIYRLSKQVINPAADFGEGWFLPGEICHLAQSGVNKIVSVQPFGCIANHIISKGIEKRLKTVCPNLSLLFLDFDSGTSEANVQNRLYFIS